MYPYLVKINLYGLRYTLRFASYGEAISTYIEIKVGLGEQAVSMHYEEDLVVW